METVRRQVPHRLYLDEDAEVIVVNGRMIPREKLSPGPTGFSAIFIITLDGWFH
jgi:hypothetical protein